MEIVPLDSPRGPVRDYQERRRDYRIAQCSCFGAKYAQAAREEMILGKENDLEELDSMTIRIFILNMYEDMDIYAKSGKKFRFMVDISYFPFILTYLDTRGEFGDDYPTLDQDVVSMATINSFRPSATIRYVELD